MSGQGAMLAQTHGPALSEFNRRLGHDGAVIMLDYDGTLAPFAPDPAAVRPWPGVSGSIDALVATGRARVIVVTGRYLRSAPPLLDTRHQPEIWGSHGRERQFPDGRYVLVPVGAAATRALATAAGWAEAVVAAGGRVETKPGSIAYHWRGAAPGNAERIREIVAGGFSREGLAGPLELCDFDGGIELREPGIDKGSVVEAILAETAGARPVAYLGDDLTDEDAFRALRGRGLGVLVRSRRRHTAASLWVRPPEELLALLDGWRAALAGRSP